MALYKNVNGQRVALAPQEEAARIAESDANQVKIDARIAKENELKVLKDTDRAALGTRAALIKEINDLAGATPAMKTILRKLARVVYNREKGTID